MKLENAQKLRANQMVQCNPLDELHPGGPKMAPFAGRIVAPPLFHVDASGGVIDAWLEVLSLAEDWVGVRHDGLHEIGYPRMVRGIKTIMILGNSLLLDNIPVARSSSDYPLERMAFHYVRFYQLGHYINGKGEAVLVPPLGL